MHGEMAVCGHGEDGVCPPAERPRGNPARPCLDLGLPASRAGRG